MSRPLPLALLATALVGLGVAGCGRSSVGSASHAPTGAHATQSAATQDRDDDSDHNDDDGSVLEYGHAATPAEQRALVALVTQYYAAAGAAEGAKACALMVPFIAESVAENYGHTPGLQGKTCAIVMSKLFHQRHQLLSSESATLKGVTARVEGGTALTVLDFTVLPEVRQITERRVGGRWRMLYLLDHIVE